MYSNSTWGNLYRDTSLLNYNKFYLMRSLQWYTYLILNEKKFQNSTIPQIINRLKSKDDFWFVRKWIHITSKFQVFILFSLASYCSIIFKEFGVGTWWNIVLKIRVTFCISWWWVRSPKYILRISISKNKVVLFLYFCETYQVILSNL